MKAEDTYVGQVVRASGRYWERLHPRASRSHREHYSQTGVEAASKSLPDEMVRSRCEREVVAESVASSEQFGESPWLDISQSRADLLTVLFREGVVFDMEAVRNWAWIPRARTQSRSYIVSRDGPGVRS